MFAVRVKGGTNSGRKHQTKLWECSCPHPIWKDDHRTHPAWELECGDCGDRFAYDR